MLVSSNRVSSICAPDGVARKFARHWVWRCRGPSTFVHSQVTQIVKRDLLPRKRRRISSLLHIDYY